MRRLLAALLALILVPGIAFGSEGLGISVSFERSEQTDAELAGSVWVGVEPGEQATRTITIESLSSDTAQQLEFEIYDQIRVDGVSETDFSQPGFITPWVSFEPANPILPPGERVSVTMTLTIPLGAQEQAYETVLRVLGGAVDLETAADPDAPTPAIVGTKIAIDSGMWVGIGDALALAPDFELTGVDGVLIDELNYVRIFFQNTGIMPIRPIGTFQLSDPSFAERVFAPIEFRGPEILSGNFGFVDVPVEPDVVDGFYRTFVTAQSGTVRKTALFEGELVFDDPNALSIPEIAIRIGMFVIAALGLVFGVRLLRSGSKTPATKKPKQPRATRVAKHSRAETAQPALPESQDTLELLRQMVEKLESQQVEIRKLAESVPVKPAPRSTRPKTPTKPATGTPKAKAKVQTLPKAAAPKTTVVKKAATNEAVAPGKPVQKTRKPPAKKE
jgi:hypothetical protein